MRKTFTLIFVLFCTISVFGQFKVQSKLPGDLRRIKIDQGIIEYAGTKTSNIRVPAPKAYRDMQNGRTTASSNFKVKYIGFSPEAQAAFQEAIDIWASLLNSDVTIRIEAHWDHLDPEKLGSAWPADAFGGSFGPKAFVWYPAALAEKILGRDLNDTTSADIIAQFNADANWYLGSDGNPASDEFDLVTVVLHEICHGLGFYDYTSVDVDGNGYYNFESSGYPFVYTAFLENGSGENIIANYDDGTIDLADQLQSEDLFFNGFLGKKDFGNVVPIYAPRPYEDGSSISHLDPNRVTSLNGLMRPGISPGMSIHDPGVALEMLGDMGWLNTSFHFDLIPNSEDFNSPVPVSVNITSDTDIDSSSVAIIYSHFNTNPDDPWGVPSAIDTIALASAGKGDFNGTLPTYNEPTLYTYYLKVVDKLGRTFTTPPEAPTYYYQFAVITDNSPPTLNHDPVLFVPIGTTEVPLEATAYDFIGIKSIVVDYSIAGVAQTPFELVADSTDETHFTGTITLDANLPANTEIQYKLTATDNAATAHQASAPETGFYTFSIEAPYDAQISYVNDFTNPTNDFLGDLFTESTVSGFSSQAFHSPHPYLEGPSGGAKNYISQLRYPIVLDNDSAFIQFKEIVLVEPGADGSQFGYYGFWDYVIVEGSKDEGKTWIPFLNGYDCRAQSDWESVYNAGINGDDSNSLGDPSLYHFRKIDMLKNGYFSPGDTVQIRFRLYSDELAKGWGWAIDNLRIQSLITGLKNVLDNQDIRIYPNPSSGVITINANFREPVENGRITIMNLMGKTIFSKPITSRQTSVNEEIDMSGAPDGIYLVSIEVPQGKLIRKIIKSN